MKQKIPRIYLDNCCYNRPYDKQNDEIISAETSAKISVQDMIRSGKLTLASSFMLRYEISKSPNRTAKRQIMDFVDIYASHFEDYDVLPVIRGKIEEIMSEGIKYKDACHVAYAEYMNCDYFLSTDKRLLKYKSNALRLLNPVEFVKIIKEEY